MSAFAFFGALQLGLIFSFIAFGVYLSFRVLDFPDLTVDGSFPLGAAVSASLIVAGVDPFIATGVAILAGACAGMLTAWLYVRLGILHLLASILVMIALYSINLRIMDGPNMALIRHDTILTPLTLIGLDKMVSNLIFFTILMCIVGLLLYLFLHTQIGLAMRAVGINRAMAGAQGVQCGYMTMLGMAISNAMVAFSGSLFAQSQGIADITMGVGTIVLGLAAVIGGEALIAPRTVLRALIACVVGVLLYRLAVQFAFEADFIGLKAQDLNLITAILVTVAIVMPRIKAYRRRRKSVS